MAERVEEWPRRRYPWDEWLDGSIWVAKEGVDYKCSRRTFRSNVYEAARARGLRIRVTDVDAGVAFQVLGVREDRWRP